MKRRLQPAIALIGLLALVPAPPVAAQKAAPALAPAEVTKVLDQAEQAAKKEERSFMTNLLAGGVFVLKTAP